MKVSALIHELTNRLAWFGDGEVVIRVCTRDEGNCITSVREVPISRVLIAKKVKIAIEERELEEARPRHPDMT